MNSFSVQNLILQELQRDCFEEDVTAQLLGEKGDRISQAILVPKQNGVFSGQSLLEAFQSVISPRVQMRWSLKDGEEIVAQKPLLELTGPAHQILSLERTLLNFLGLSCGVATLTRQFVLAIKPFPVTLLATRKTLPGLRELQLAAVEAGGGKIHRRSLSDGILIKENHCAIENASTLLKSAHEKRSPLHGIEIEVQDFNALARVLKSPYRPDVIMLDNFSSEDAVKAVAQIRDQAPGCRIEASGGMCLETVRQFAEAGVDYISVGQLTHSVPVFNLSLDFQT